MNHRVYCLYMYFSGTQWCNNAPGLRYTLEQRMFLVKVFFKYDSAAKCGRQFPCQFPGQPLPSKQTWSINWKQEDRCYTNIPTGNKLCWQKINWVLLYYTWNFTMEISWMARSGDEYLENVCRKDQNFLQLRPQNDNSSSGLEGMWSGCSGRNYIQREISNKFRRTPESKHSFH